MSIHRLATLAAASLGVHQRTVDTVASSMRWANGETDPSSQEGSPRMRRRLALLAALSSLALALSASPAMAGNQASGPSGWFVYGGGSEPVEGFQETCGTSTYTVVSGSLDSVWQMKGNVDPATGLMTNHGHVIETWTANHVVVVDQAGMSHRVVFSRRMQGSLAPGASLEDGPFVNFSWIEHFQITGTSDGYSLVMDLHHTTFSGTCDLLPN